MTQRNRGASLKAVKSRTALTVTYPNAAGIDIGSAAHFVAVPPDRADMPVREFASFTVDLHAIADWLKACGVDTVAMESTGVYWVPLFELLETRGFTVFLVNARHVRNVSGRMSDVLDCQCLQQLMTYGLLSGAFRPADQVCVLRSLWRQRGMSIRSQGRFVQHMQKALTQMNIQLANVIADVAGETGQKILRAIVAGERNGHVLGAMKNARTHASIDEIARSLQGNWRAEHLFELKQALAAFDFVATQLAECDREVEAQLQALQAHDGEPEKGKKRCRARNAEPGRRPSSGRTAAWRRVGPLARRGLQGPKFDLRTRLFQMCGVDLTRIDGIDVSTALAVIGETGADMSRFESVTHFASWLGLCPGTKITGGKVMSGKTKRCANCAAQALRLAAAALRTSQSALGAYFRRLCARMDKPKAVTAAAHKLARLIYSMLSKGEEYTDRGQYYYKERYRVRVPGPALN